MQMTMCLIVFISFVTVEVVCENVFAKTRFVNFQCFSCLFYCSHDVFIRTLTHLTVMIHVFYTEKGRRLFRIYNVHRV